MATVEAHRVGKRYYGGFVRFDSGREMYVARRRFKEIFRNAEPSVSIALKNGNASWAIDTATLEEVKQRGIKYVGVISVDTGDLYVTWLASFFDASRARVHDYSSKGGAVQRYLPIQYFAHMRKPKLGKSR